MRGYLHPSRLGQAMLSLCALIMVQFSSVIHAEETQATLELPEAFNLKYLDGAKYKRSFFSSGDLKLELQPGSHQLIVEYEEIWELNADDHERVQSEPLSVTFVAVAGGQYALRYPELDSVDDASAYAKAPVVTIVDRHNEQEVPSDQAYQLKKEGFLQSLVTPAKPAPAVKAERQETVRAEESQPVPQSDNDRALEMLHYWWEQAGEVQRRKFLRSIEQ